MLLAMDDAPNAMNDADQPFRDGGTLWDARDVARYLKTSRSWVYQKAEAGLLPSLRIGGLLRFEPHVVRAWARGAPAGENDRPRKGA
jgi:excisionase family DNA binding protein